MITRPTALILGAGASAPYGFPTGTGLRDIVCKDLGDGRTGVSNYLAKTQYGSDEIARFTTELRESGRPSVDAFLEHRRDLLPIGKAAIAAGLIPFETPLTLFNDLSSAGRWYAHLFEQMEALPDEWVSNRLTVVTYNYDRSLEFFLHTALRRSYRLTDADADALLSTQPIIHLHGQLAALGHPGNKDRPYEDAISNASINNAANGIRIVSEAKPEAEVFAQARQALSSAERIYVLGFGYSVTNLERLGRSCFEGPQLVGGSSFGFTDREVRDIHEWFGGSMKLGDPTHNILTFLRHSKSMSRP